VEHLRFAPGILRRLGEELNPNPDQGIIELVRNAYDADASSCRIELLDVDKAGGSIRIADDGIGMEVSDLVNGWLILGKSGKQAERVTASGRKVVGNKGLGRLAALRLGQIATVETKTAKASKRLRLRLDWHLFDNAQVVEEVPLQIEPLTEKTKGSHGTTVIIEKLRATLSHAEVRRLARSLVLLADPFGAKGSFRPSLIAPAFADLEKLVRSAYFDQAEFHLVASLTAGMAKASVLDYKGETLFEANHAQIRKTKGKEEVLAYEAPDAVFDLWVFLLDGEKFATRNVTLTEVKDWLNDFGGVHLYDRGLRVHPYGDKGHDWLDMNLARTRNPELRPATNTSLGRLEVKDNDEMLVQKTDRTGFIENQAFTDLRRFAMDSLEWMARSRLEQRESRRATVKQEVPPSIREATVGIESALKRIAPASRKHIQEAVGKYQKARDREARSLRDDLQLYRTLSTVGTTSAVLAHELKKPVRQIGAMARMIERIGKRELPARYDATLASPVSQILRASDSLKTFANVTTTLLEREKRRQGRVSLSAVVTEIIALLKPFLDEAQVSVTTDFVDHEPAIFGSISSCESIVANLLTNSINAFSYSQAKSANRKIQIRTSASVIGLELQVEDNGPGIQGLDLKDIWLPGQSTTPGGTGLGLTIVRDAVNELGGTVTASAKGALGGAAFKIAFPVMRGAK
jgi:signal transduction histidine kinase